MSAKSIRDNFRSSSEQVKQLREAFALPVVRDAFTAMKETAPENFPMIASATKTENRQLGRIEGYAEYHNQLLRLAMQPEVVAKIEATYEEDN